MNIDRVHCPKVQGGGTNSKEKEVSRSAAAVADGGFVYIFSVRSADETAPKSGAGRLLRLRPGSISGASK
jgi:hypothetical protein